MTIPFFKAKERKGFVNDSHGNAKEIVYETSNQSPKAVLNMTIPFFKAKERKGFVNYSH
jgi:hypothetical protein